MKFFKRKSDAEKMEKAIDRWFKNNPDQKEINLMDFVENYPSGFLNRRKKPAIAHALHAFEEVKPKDYAFGYYLIDQNSRKKCHEKFWQNMGELLTVIDSYPRKFDHESQDVIPVAMPFVKKVNM